MPLTPPQLTTLRAALARIIPRDQDPVALEAGLDDYILQQLQGDLKPHADLYSAALTALENESQTLHQKPFPALTPEQQDTLLTSLETNSVKTSWPPTPQRFLSLLVDHAQEGFYTDPAHGGNRNAVSWKMLGYRPEGGTYQKEKGQPQ